MRLNEESSLAKAVAERILQDGEIELATPGVKLYRTSDTTKLLSCMYITGLAVMVQGNKDIIFGQKTYRVHAGQSLITSTDLPVMNCVTKASSEEPYLGLWLKLDLHSVAELTAEMDSPVMDNGITQNGLTVLDLDRGTKDALIRLLQLSDEPELISHISPLIQKEIVIRLLNGSYGSTLRQAVSQGSPLQRITNVTARMKDDYSKDISITVLAEMANMSPSTFRQHFRAITGVSPLQYLKQIRLFEARRLMLNEHSDAGSAAIQVGYESASQFSREYTRLFGDSPLRDIKRLRETA